MPNLFTSKCNKCDFETSMSAGGHLFVRDENGNKVACGHPIEHYKISEVLKIPKDDAFAWLMQDFEKITPETKKKIDDNTGMDYQYICLDCLSETFLDPKKEELKCSKCGSTNLKHVAELENQVCPKCKEGVVQKIRKGIS